jgi:hypothetical protein
MIRRVPSALFLLALAVPLCAGPTQAEDSTQPLVLESVGLRIQPPPLTELVLKPHASDEMLAWWQGKLGDHTVDAKLIFIPREQHSFSEPEDLLNLIAEYVSKIPGYRFQEIDFEEGEFGYAPYAALGTAPTTIGTRETARNLVLGGVLAKGGYYIWVSISPPPIGNDTAAEELRQWLLDGVRYEGEKRDQKWNEEEVEFRWKQFAPEGLDSKKELKKLKLLRTKHYIIMTNSGGGKSFGKEMEKCYKAIKKVYPFQEVEGRRLMPVFLFQEKGEYNEFFSKKAGISIAEAAKSKGHASGDYYATYYDAPQDPVHIHEATHQIFSARLGLTGAGSWFQEGVAEYMSENSNLLENYGGYRARKGTFTPLEEFFQIESLLYSAGEDTTGAGGAGSNYTMAATIILFLRESKFGKKKFQEFLHEVGVQPRNNVEYIGRAVQKVYGVSIPELQEEYAKFWKKK